MTDFDEIIRRDLEEDWGPAARHSEYHRGDSIRYRVGFRTYTGIIIWVAAQGPSRVEGRDRLPLRYIVERSGWSGFPDVVYSGDIIVT